DQLGPALQSLNTDLSRDTFNAQKAGATLNLLSASSSQASPEAKQLVAQLRTLLPAESEAQRKYFAERLEAVLKKASEACLAAKKENDLDPVLADLQSLKQHGYSESPEFTRALGRREAAIRFVTRWQEYLTNLTTGYDDRAKNILRE